MPYGLRSLSPKDPEYHGYYGGDVLARDGAYHRGTGWGWLIGPYLDAYYRVKVESGEDETTVFEAIESMVVGACSHLSEVCLGQYCENFDGDEPHHGRGCMAQAWSVAELLRWVTKINEFKLRRASQ
jgi:glycogen debranching enzyme